ncbi:MAG: glycosyltransferase [Actinobacteria bacterium]|nr:glycosyltransferase [Actinomycetota bacterium]
MKVLHISSNIAGQTRRLVKAERRLGIGSDMLSFVSGWPGVDSGGFVMVVNKKNYFGKIAGRLRVFLANLKKYDVFHFYFGDSFLYYEPLKVDNWDLPILAMLGKKIVMTFQGCDIRRRDLFLREFDLSPCTYCEDPCDSLRKASKVRKIAKYADALFVSTPDLLLVAPQAQVRPQIAPYLLPSTRTSENTSEDNSLRIFHSPSKRLKKGTEFLISACRKLQNEKYPIELVLSEGVPWNINVETMKGCDVVIDQLCGGWYGNTSVEGMTLGLPTVCYIRDEFLEKMPYGQEFPIINARTDNIYQVLKEIFQNKAMLEGHAEKGPFFVQKYHRADRIAQVTACAYGFITQSRLE